jgi:hypothetical protein
MTQPSARTLQFFRPLELILRRARFHLPLAAQPLSRASSVIVVCNQFGSEFVRHTCAQRQRQYELALLLP